MSDKPDTTHREIDAESVMLRTATRQLEQEHRLDGNIEPRLLIIEARTERLPFIEEKLDLALTPRPVHPIVQASIVVGALALAILAFVSIVRAPSASASTSTITETAHR